MTKKHYVRIAKLLKHHRDIAWDNTSNQTPLELIEDLIDDFEVYFATNNPAFDIDKFNKAVYGDFV